MLSVKTGENGPRVVWLQILLNRAGAELAVDGRYGPLTDAAVHAFQDSSGLPAGDAGVQTFHQLAQSGIDRVIDAVDVGDPGLAVIPAATSRFGSTPIVLGAMCNGIEVLVNQVVGRARAGSVAVLRIFGHGNLGRWMTVSVGAVVHQGRDGRMRLVKDYPLIAQSGSFISANTFDAAAMKLARLKPCFAPYGSFEHGGCSLGSRADTRNMMGRLSDLLDVPVTVGISLQRSVFHFDGPTFTAYPKNAGLAGWSKRLSRASY
jgi:hypothetical protein